MKAKLKIIIPLVIAAAAITVAAFCIGFTPADKAEDISSLVSTAQKYLIENNYEQAIAEFKAIIELDPKNVEAYLGLAEAYIGIGDTDKAIEILEKGYELTGSERLKKMLDELYSNSVEQTENTSEAQEESETAVTTVPTETTTEEEITTTTYARITVPDLSGLSRSEAISVCENAGLNYSISESESDSVEKGFVMIQYIPAGSEVDENTVFMFAVSTGVKGTSAEAVTTVPVTSTNAPAAATAVPVTAPAVTTAVTTQTKAPVTTPVVTTAVTTQTKAPVTTPAVTTAVTTQTKAPETTPAVTTTVPAETSAPETTAAAVTEKETVTNIDGSYYEMDIDSDGKIVHEVFYDENGEYFGEADVEYYPDGSKKSETYRRVDGTYYVSEYDKNGNKTKTTHYNSDKSINYYEIFEYDSNNNLLSRTSYYADNGLREYSKSKYDSKNHEIYYENYTSARYNKETWKNKNRWRGETCKWNIEYNNDYTVAHVRPVAGNSVRWLIGNGLKECYSYYNNRINGHYVYEYDESGRVISYKKYNGSNSYYGYCERSYDGKGNLIEDKDYLDRGDGNVELNYHWVWTRDGLGNIITSTGYNKDGSVYWQEKY